MALTVTNNLVLARDADIAAVNVEKRSFRVHFELKLPNPTNDEVCQVGSFTFTDPKDIPSKGSLLVEVYQIAGNINPATIPADWLQEAPYDATKAENAVNLAISLTEATRLFNTFKIYSQDFMVSVSHDILHLYTQILAKDLPTSVGEVQDLTTATLVQVPFTYTSALGYLNNLTKSIPLITLDPSNESPTIQNQSLRNVIRYYFSTLWVFVPSDHRTNFMKLIYNFATKNSDLKALALPDTIKTYDSSKQLLHLKSAFFFIAGYAKTPATSEICNAWTSQRINALFSKLKIQTDKRFDNFIYDLGLINTFWEMFPEFRIQIMRFCLKTPDKTDAKWEALRSQWLMLHSWTSMKLFNASYNFAMMMNTKVHFHPVVAKQIVQIHKLFKTYETDYKDDAPYAALFHIKPPESDVINYKELAYCAHTYNRKLSKTWDQFISAQFGTLSVSPSTLEALLEERVSVKQGLSSMDDDTKQYFENTINVTIPDFGDGSNNTQNAVQMALLTGVNELLKRLSPGTSSSTV